MFAAFVEGGVRPPALSGEVAGARPVEVNRGDSECRRPQRLLSCLDRNNSRDCKASASITERDSCAGGASDGTITCNVGEARGLVTAAALASSGMFSCECVVVSSWIAKVGTSDGVDARATDGVGGSSSRLMKSAPRDDRMACKPLVAGESNE